MKVEFKRSFEKDLTKLRDRALLGKVKSAIEAIEVADSLDDVANIKN